MTKAHRIGAFAVAIAFTMGGSLLPVSAAGAAQAPPPAADPAGSKLSPALAALANPTALPQTQTDQAAEPNSGPGSMVQRPDGRVLVDLLLKDKSAATLGAIEATGAKRVAVSDTDTLATYAMLPDELARLESIGGLQFAHEVITPEVGGPGLADAGAPPETNSGACPSGDRVSEADGQLNAATARTTFGVDGTGVQAAVLSDSFNLLGGMATDQAASELPGPGNTCGHTSAITILSEAGSGTGTDEGRAMAQAIHDLAPGASISAASAFNGQADFANQIRALKNNGAKVIADDVSYADELLYQEGVISKAITEVTAAGVTYFSSAANSNAIVGGKNISSYEATGGFRPTPCPALIVANACHDFDPGAGVSDGDTVTIGNTGNFSFTLGWNEPQLGVTTDLDYYLIDVAANTVVSSNTVNDITSQTPVAFVNKFTNSSGAAKTYKFVIARKGASGTPRFKFILRRPASFTSVQFNTSTGGDIIGPSIMGHNASLAGAPIAAVPYFDSNTVESFSSRGPTTYCWAPVGVGASAALPSCLTRQVEVAATDGAQNSFFGQTNLGDGLHHFFGTSQAAPHAAAVAVLQTQARPCRTPAEKLAGQRASGRPIAGFGQDALGSGLVDASAAISSLAGCALPLAPAFPSGTSGNASSLLSWFPANGNGFPITGFVITPFIGAVAQAPQTFNNAANAQTVTGLSNGTTYTFKVAAKNVNGTGPQSTTAPITIGKPVKPIFLAVSSGNGTATVGWTANGNGTAITQSVITPFIGGVAQTPQVFNNGNSAQVVTGLTNGTTYTFKITVSNAIGSGPQSAATLPIKAGLPAKIGFPSATAGHGAATVSWFPANGNGSPITGVAITPFIAGVAQPTQIFNTTANSRVVTGLTNGTAYTFKVAGINAIGTGPQSVATAAVTPTP